MQTYCNKKIHQEVLFACHIIKILWVWYTPLKQDESEGFLQSTLLQDFSKAKAFHKHSKPTQNEHRWKQVTASPQLFFTADVRLEYIQVKDTSLQFRWHNKLLWKVETILILF